ncbi:UNVERIFIED_ORG: hypothetical protein ABIC54_005093 [Burkholderia sp. 1263]
MNYLARTLAVTTAAFTINQAVAHGVPLPQHGGIMDDAGLVAVEMVAKNRTVELFVTDDDAPVDARNIKGVLTVTSASGAKKETPIAAVSGNQLRSQDVEVPPGSRVTALLTMADGTTKVSARFKVQ